LFLYLPAHSSNVNSIELALLDPGYLRKAEAELSLLRGSQEKKALSAFLDTQ
jgi:hypothetical protein